MVDAPGDEPRRRVEFARNASKRDITFTSMTGPGDRELRAELVVLYSRRTYTVAAMTPAALDLRFAATYNGSATSSGAIAVNLDDPLARSFAITQQTHAEAPGAQLDVTSTVTLRSQP